VTALLTDELTATPPRVEDIYALDCRPDAL
jgi:hypothetical protein